jgi:outer membrane protein OmpA-like peptidoglycan-associated protein
MRRLLVSGLFLASALSAGGHAQAPISATIPAYLTDELVDGRPARVARAKRGGLSGVQGVETGAYMDEQEKALRTALTDTGVRVVRSGDELLLTIPSGINFAYKSASVDPRFAPTLDRAAVVLAKYDRTFVDVYGHTDSVASDTYNQKLSQDRAASVARYLEGHGVIAARVGTRGFGKMQALASNETEEGRATNRRVEIRIVAIPQIELQR